MELGHPLMAGSEDHSWGRTGSLQVAAMKLRTLFQVELEGSALRGRGISLEFERLGES